VVVVVVVVARCNMRLVEPMGEGNVKVGRGEGRGERGKSVRREA